ncbi:ATP-dependent DNA helicase RecG [soil metagenome]
MDVETKRRVDALRRPLELAAADGFKGVRKVAGLGHALRAACDGVIAKLEDKAALEQWREILGRWESIDEGQQAVEVARGMRLIARFPRMASPVSRASAPRLRSESVPRQPVPVPVPVPVPIDPPTRPPAPTAKKAKKPKPDPDLDPLAQPTHTLPGIGPAFAEKLAEKGLRTVEDLLWMVPRRYDDVRDAKQLLELNEMEEGARVTFAAKVISARMIFARGRRWAEVKLHGLDGTASCVVRWFNVWAGIDKRMPPGCQVVLNGVVKRRNGQLELANPDILGIEIEGVAGKAMPSIITRYPDIPGVPGSRLRSACAAACARVASGIDDGVPASVERAAALPSMGDTLTRLHSPSPDIAPDEIAALNAGVSIWQKRLAFGELFALGVAITLRRRERRQDLAVPCVRKPGVAKELERALPFTLTGAQQRSIEELAGDLSRDVPMNRLLQGDVGAGKTTVAFAAALQVARSGRQVAVMAPTELLAEQHLETWKRWAEVAKLRLEVLTASTPKGVRHSLLAMLGAGHVDVVIGTHSLLAEAVGFSALGLVIIDEQHRFGVAQRARLRDKGDGQGAPHLLVMTATPIPRTLALTAFGDLDVSALDELPPGRLPVTTKQLLGARGRAAAYKLIAERIAAGERAYIVCPKVAPSDGDDEEGSRDWADATTTVDEARAAIPGARVGLVHGRLDGVERDRAMRAFKTGDLDVLVATTVIEVGVDVPAATVMVVHDAERFGLAQLHQLRGRVGRGGGPSHCLLLARGALGPDAETRLGAMVETHDGFRIAEYDLALRGPGELLGPRQAGVPTLRFGDLHQHTTLLLEARAHAEAILDEDSTLARPEHAALRRAIDRRFAHHVYGAESG